MHVAWLDQGSDKPIKVRYGLLLNSIEINEFVDHDFSGTTVTTLILGSQLGSHKLPR